MWLCLFYFQIISKFVEKESGVVFEKILFSSGSANRDRSLRPRDPLPGQQENGSERPTNLEMILIFNSWGQT